jgi:hypothetical protein
MEGFETGNVDQVMDVFDETSLIVYGANVYRGLKEIRDFFKYIMSDVLPPDVQINGIHEVVEDGVAYFIWSSNPTKCEVSLGMDSMFIENGMISRQTVYLAFEG